MVMVEDLVEVEVPVLSVLMEFIVQSKVVLVELVCPQT